MTLTVAAQRLGWHPRKVESRARRERWPRRAANRGRAGEYLIPAELLAGTAEMTPPAAEPGAASGAAADGANPAGWAELAAELRHENVGLWAELAVERTARAKAEGELAAELRRSADLVATVAELRRELAEARKPALLRLLEALRRR